MAIMLTDECKSYIVQSLNKRGKGLGIRIGVKTSGCSGLAYMLEYVDIKDEFDVEFIFDRVSVFVSPNHLPYIDGTTVDYETSNLGAGIKFINPQETNVCGCGKSFST